MGPRRLSLLLYLATSAFAQSGMISGTVVDSQKIPLSGANMYLTIEMGGCPSTVATTDNNGRFQFPNAQPGRYRVKAAKVGYITQEFGERAKRTPGFGANIILTPSAPSADVEIVLPRGSQISGTVLDEQGRPLARGYVFFQNPEITSQSFHALTDGTGHYYVTDLPPGQYHVSARRFSEQANQVVGDLWFYPGTTDKNLAALVPLGDNAAVADIHFGGVRSAPGVVRVHTEQGAPVARAEVVIRRQQEQQSSIDTLRTGADGRAEIRTLPPGEYSAYVSKLPPPLASWRNPMAEATSLDRYAKQFRVASGQTDVSIDFAVAAGVELSGRFLMKDGSPPPTHTISLDLLSSPASMSFLVKPAKLDHESFVFQGMSAGEPYTLREFQDDHLKPLVIVQIRLNGVPLRGDDIVVPAQNLEIVLDHAAVISGFIKSAPKSGTVTAKRIDGDAPAALHPPLTRTEVVNGRFVFRGLPPGTYVIAGTQQVEVKPAETVELSL